MNIDITKLNNNSLNSIDIDFTYSFKEDELENSNIKILNDLTVTGQIMNNHDDYLIDLVLTGTMKLEDTLTLELIDYPFNTKVEGNISELLEEIGESFKKTENTIDIFPIIWENILMEIPIRVVSEKSYDKKMEGEGWRLIHDNEPTLNPELQKLNDLFK